MEENSGVSKKEAIEKLYSFVIEQIKAGTDKSTISSKLQEMGLDKTEAYDLVETLHFKIMKVAEEERFSIRSFIPGLIGGISAAIVGGILWQLVVLTTGYEIGFMAWGLGWMTGFGVVLFSRGKKGIPLQIVAVLTSIFGIVLGKYLIFVHYLKEVLIEKFGAEAVSNISLTSKETIQAFSGSLGLMVDGFDILWIILAVVTAWKIPKGIRLKSQKSA